MDTRDVHRLSVSWIGALVVFAAIAAAGCWLSVRSLHEVGDGRLLLAVSRQRMLSQRVALLAHQYVATRDEFVRLDLRWEMRLSADEMQALLAQHTQPGRTWRATRPESAPATAEPLSDRPLSVVVAALYNEPPMLLMRHMTDLSTSVWQLVTPGATEFAKEPALAAHIQATASSVLPGLDRLVDQVTQEHEAAVQAQVSRQYQILAGTLAALLAAGLMLAKPGLRFGADAKVQRVEAKEESGTQFVSNHPAASTPVSPPLSTAGPKTAKSG